MPALSELPLQKPISYAQVRNEICDGDIPSAPLRMAHSVSLTVLMLAHTLT